MASQSVFTKLSQPVPVPIASVDLMLQSTFFMAGIVNPLGPTLGILSS